MLPRAVRTQWARTALFGMQRAARGRSLLAWLPHELHVLIASHVGPLTPVFDPEAAALAARSPPPASWGALMAA